MRTGIAGRSTLFILMVLVGLVVSGCEDSTVMSPPDPPRTELSGVANVTVVRGDGFTRVEGEKAGALFQAIRPDDWNGDLVLLMHGLVLDPKAPVTLFDPVEWWIEPVLEGLLDGGFGVASSSYRVNGVAVQEGAIDTRIAQAMFTAHFGRPEHTYLYGWSMGGSVGQLLLETSPDRYDGFLSVCGTLGGWSEFLGYQLDARVLFDHFFPGVLPWSVWNDHRNFFEEVQPAVVGAFVADPAGFVAKGRKLASIDQLDLPRGSGTPQELLLSVLGSLVAFGGGNADLVEKAHGIPLDNTETVYTSDLLTQAEIKALNDDVSRFEADPPAARYLERYYDPDGQIRGTPLFALHTEQDAVVPPESHLPVYRRTLEGTSNGDRFVARVVEGFGHCEFGADLQPDAFLDVQLDAFAELVGWAEGGPKPAP